MSAEVVNLMCPSCGAPTNTSQKNCEFCQRPIVITSFNSVSDMPMAEINKYANAYEKTLADNPNNADINASIGMCYLKLKLHDKALVAFEKAIESNFDNSELFFYAAVCLLNGKKASLIERKTIDKIMKYLDSAIMIEPRGIYYYARAYVKLDYFERKFLNISPKWDEELARAKDVGISETDVNSFYAILGVASLAKLDISSPIHKQDERKLSLGNDNPNVQFTAFRKKKSLVTALVLAIILPGAGLIYIGKILYGIIWLLLSAVILIATNNSVALTTWALINLVIIIFNVILTWYINEKNGDLED